ncbi:MAG: ABC transporter ATP-binding protein, partial [Rhodospirillales bacterium]
MIEARQLSMHFGGRLVVDGISFTVEPGTVAGFLGPNGAGKTTTMRLLTGFLRPVSGTALICGHDIGRAPRAAQACFGYLPEAATGFPNLTVREFLTYCGEARGVRGGALKAAIDRVCGRIALGPALETRMKELSKGWRQRAWLAPAIVHDPPVLIMDEPTDGLDPNQKLQVRQLIRAVAPEKAILLSTHILEEAEEVCNRAIIIAGGRVVADDAPASLADRRGRLGEAF